MTSILEFPIVENEPSLWRGGNTTDEDMAYEAAHDKKMIAETRQTIDALCDGFDGISEDERYKRIRKFISDRFVQEYEHMNGGNSLPGNRAAFDALGSIRTESYYTKRLIKWAMTREAHPLLADWELAYYDVDVQASDRDVVDAWADMGQVYPVPEGIKFQLSEKALSTIDKAPEDEGLIRFGLDAINNDPSFSDEDFYPPSPYKAIDRDSAREGIAPDEVELSLETADVFGVTKISDISERARRQLFHVGVRLDEAAHARLRGVAHNLSPDMRNVFADAYLATEFGDDLGEAILQIAERGTDDARAIEILRQVSSVRAGAAEWESTAWFADTDSKYRAYFTGIKQAVEMRVSQMLSLAPDLLDGNPQQAEYFHRDGTSAKIERVDSIDEVLTGLRVLNLALRKIAQAESASPAQRKLTAGDDFMLVSTSMDGYGVSLMMRPHESSQAEARIRWAVEISPQEQLVLFGSYLDVNKLGQPRSARLSLRLDLEKISARLSLDAGSSMEYGNSQREYPSRLLACLVTAGVQHQLRAAQDGIAHHDYHVRDTFDPELARPEAFADFVQAAQEHYLGSRRVSEVGGLAARAVTGRERLVDVRYTGLFLDDDTTQRLRAMWPTTLPNIPSNLHVTLKFNPRDGLNGLNPGERTTIKVLGIVDDGKAQALIIGRSGMAAEVKSPHITLSTGNDENGRPIPPSYSKRTIIDMQANRGVNWLKEPIELTVTGGYLDGKTGKIILGT